MKYVRHRCQLAPANPVLRTYGVSKPLVRVGYDYFHSGQAACHHRAQEAQPKGAVLTGAHVQDHDLSLALYVHRSINHYAHVDYPATFPTFCVSASSHRYAYGPPSRGRLRNFSATSPSPRQMRDTWLFDMPSHPSAFTKSSTLPGGHALYIRLLYHCQQRLLAPTPRLKQTRGVASVPQLRYAQLHRPTRVSQLLLRFPLRWVTRSGLRSP